MRILPLGSSASKIGTTGAGITADQLPTTPGSATAAARAVARRVPGRRPRLRVIRRTRRSSAGTEMPAVSAATWRSAAVRPWRGVSWAPAVAGRRSEAASNSGSVRAFTARH